MCEIIELFPIDAQRMPHGRLAQLNREIAKIEEMGWEVTKEIEAVEKELYALRSNAKLILHTYRMALDERDAVSRQAVRA